LYDWLWCGKVRALSLMSGEFDSPVASYLMAEKGLKLDFIHFDPQPYSDGSLLKKTLLIFDWFKEKGYADKLYVINQKEVIDAIIARAPKKYLILLWRRYMVRYASAMRSYSFLVTGDNLGQVASQTLYNMYAIDEASSLPILRPLLLWNKKDIVKKSKELGFYEISSQPSHCLLELPKYFVTKSDLQQIKELEKKISFPQHLKVEVFE